LLAAWVGSVRVQRADEGLGAVVFEGALRVADTGPADGDVAGRTGVHAHAGHGIAGIVLRAVRVVGAADDGAAVRAHAGRLVTVPAPRAVGVAEADVAAARAAGDDDLAGARRESQHARHTYPSAPGGRHAAPHFTNLESSRMYLAW